MDFDSLVLATSQFCTRCDPGMICLDAGLVCPKAGKGEAKQTVHGCLAHPLMNKTSEEPNPFHRRYVKAIKPKWDGEGDCPCDVCKGRKYRKGSKRSGELAGAGAKRPRASGGAAAQDAVAAPQAAGAAMGLPGNAAAPEAAPALDAATKDALKDFIQRHGLNALEELYRVEDQVEGGSLRNEQFVYMWDGQIREFSSTREAPAFEQLSPGLTLLAPWPLGSEDYYECSFQMLSDGELTVEFDDGAVGVYAREDVKLLDPVVGEIEPGQRIMAAVGVAVWEVMGDRSCQLVWRDTKVTTMLSLDDQKE